MHAGTAGVHADVPRLLGALITAQRQPITIDSRHIPALAGTSFAKTRMMVRRIGSLAETRGAPTHGVLAVTSNHHASAEIRHRTSQLAGKGRRGIWIGTS